MHQSDKQNKLLDLATDILLSKDVRGLACEARKAFSKGVDGVRWEATDTALRPLLARFDALVLPLVEKLPPAKTVSDRIRSGLGRMLFVRFLQNAACTSVSLRKLAQRYARDLLTYSSTTFRHRTVVPLLAFQSEREFSLVGTIGREQYRCRLVKLNRRAPELFGHYAFPSPADYSFSHTARMWEDAQWAAVIDVVAPRRDDGDVGRSVPSACDVPRTLVTALRLFADGEVHYAHTYETYEALHLSGTFFLKLRIAGGIAPLHLTSGMIRGFRKWWKRLEPHIPFEEKLPPRVALAVAYFNASYGNRAESEFLDLHIALESLTDVHTEQTYRLPLRVSALLAKTKADAVSLAEEAKSYWDIRCKIAHGTLDIRKSKYQTRIRAELPKLRALLRRMIHAHLQLFESVRCDIGAYEKSIKEFDTTRILTRGYRR